VQKKKATISLLSFQETKLTHGKLELSK